MTTNTDLLRDAIKSDTDRLLFTETTEKRVMLNKIVDDFIDQVETLGLDRADDDTDFDPKSTYAARMGFDDGRADWLTN